MIPCPPMSTLTDTPFPSTTLFRSRLDMLQRATTESERQYALNVVETECPDSNDLARYKRAYKWVVAFCTWKYKNPSLLITSKPLKFPPSPQIGRAHV